MILPVLSPDYIEDEVAETVTRTITFETKDSFVLSNLLMDRGDGYRPFHPLAGTIDGTTLALPMLLTAGTHMISLTGEQFSGIRLMLCGRNLFAIERITLGELTAAATVASTYSEDFGPPDDADGVDNAWYWDKNPASLGGQKSYHKMGGAWKEQQS
jgi:hypothetical protein